MSAEDNTGNPPDESSASDPLKELKSEFARKTDKLAQENANLSAQLNQILAAVQPKVDRSSNNVSMDDDLDELAYKDPKAFAKRVREEATKHASQYVNQSMQAQQQSNAVLSQLVSEYPELGDQRSELSLRAVEIYKGLSEADRSNPMSYKVAVRDAASELGILTKTKRRSSGDDFSLSGSNEGNSSNQSRQRSSEVDNRTIAFAELLGLNTKDKKVVERIKARSGRKSWGKYE